MMWKSVFLTPKAHSIRSRTTTPLPLDLRKTLSKVENLWRASHPSTLIVRIYGGRSSIYTSSLHLYLQRHMSWDLSLTDGVISIRLRNTTQKIATSLKRRYKVWSRRTTSRNTSKEIPPKSQTWPTITSVTILKALYPKGKGFMQGIGQRDCTPYIQYYCRRICLGHIDQFHPMKIYSLDIN